MQGSISNQKTVGISIFNLAGRLIRCIEERGLDAGVNVLEWDGRDSQGRIAGAGVYFARFQGDGFSATKKLVLLR
jgi:flagellar hook assembly protein FlgD